MGEQVTLDIDRQPPVLVGQEAHAVLLARLS